MGLLGLWRRQLFRERRVRGAGRTENAVPANQPGRSRLHIRTSAATTSVRGTQFRVSTDHAPASTRSEVERGTVGVAAARRLVESPEGYGAFTRVGQVPAPAVPLLPPADLAGLPELTERAPPRFELAARTGAAGYSAGIAGDPAFKRLLAELDADSTTLHESDPSPNLGVKQAIEQSRIDLPWPRAGRCFLAFTPSRRTAWSGPSAHRSGPRYPLRAGGCSCSPYAAADMKTAILTPESPVGPPTRGSRREIALIGVPLAVLVAVAGLSGLLVCADRAVRPPRVNGREARNVGQPALATLTSPS